MTCTHAALKRKDLVELAFKVSKMTECSIWLYNKQIFQYDITRVYKCVCVCVCMGGFVLRCGLIEVMKSSFLCFV